MSDFSSDFWAVYVALITLISIVACAVLLYAYSTRRAGPGGEADTTGHIWDEDLSEWNNPLPRWWMWLFYITIVFSLVYLVFYPGLGSYAGVFGWSSKGQYDEEQKQAAAEFGPLFDKYLQQDIIKVAADPAARAMGQRLFQTYCSQCHGSDAGGAKGIPNLSDDIWIWGGDPETIKTTIRDGRTGIMPPMGAAVGNAEDIRDVANYVRSLSELTNDATRAARGKVKFMAICAACHGTDGKGKHELHSADLTDKDWEYGGSEATIIETITKGRTSVMPSHKDFLDEGKIHLLTAYVYSLSPHLQK
jgi:cytochrome c oxidase cbb3-type subunit 3